MLATCVAAAAAWLEGAGPLWRLRRRCCCYWRVMALLEREMMALLQGKGMVAEHRPIRHDKNWKARASAPLAQLS